MKTSLEVKDYSSISSIRGRRGRIHIFSETRHDEQSRSLTHAPVDVSYVLDMRAINDTFQNKEEKHSNTNFLLGSSQTARTHLEGLITIQISESILWLRYQRYMMQVRLRARLEMVLSHRKPTERNPPQPPGGIQMASLFIHDNPSYTLILTLLLENCEDILRILSTSKTGGYNGNLSLPNFRDLQCNLDKLSPNFRCLKSVTLGTFPSLASEFASCEANLALFLDDNKSLRCAVPDFINQIKKFESGIKRIEQACSLLVQKATTRPGSTDLTQSSERHNGLESSQWARAAVHQKSFTSERKIREVSHNSLRSKDQTPFTATMKLPEIQIGLESSRWAQAAVQTANVNTVHNKRESSRSSVQSRNHYSFAPAMTSPEIPTGLESSLRNYGSRRNRTARRPNSTDQMDLGLPREHRQAQPNASRMQPHSRSPQPRLITGEPQKPHLLSSALTKVSECEARIVAADKADVYEFLVLGPDFSDKSSLSQHWIAAIPHRSSRGNRLRLIKAHVQHHLRSSSFELWEGGNSLSNHGLNRSHGRKGSQRLLIEVVRDPYILFTYPEGLIRQLNFKGEYINKTSIKIRELKHRIRLELQHNEQDDLQVALEPYTDDLYRLSHRLENEELSLQETGFLTPAQLVGQDGIHLIVTISRTCVLCTEQFRLFQFPRCITGRCTHSVNTCIGCLRTWIASRLDENVTDNITCTECSEILHRDEIKDLATIHEWTRLEECEKLAYLATQPNFFWCLALHCKSGQIHLTPENPIFQCGGCNYLQCIRCSVAWHTGETCDQYQYQVSGEMKAEEERATLELLARMAKQCPKCKMNYERTHGCDHITCKVCRHEFCFVCSATWGSKCGHSGMM